MYAHVWDTCVLVYRPLGIHSEVKRRHPPHPFETGSPTGPGESQELQRVAVKLLPWVSETLVFKTVFRLEDHRDFKRWTKGILHYDRVLRARE